MNQSPIAGHIKDGNLIFTKLLEFKPTVSKEPEYWNSIVKWMLFRGDSIALIKHTLHEQITALEMPITPSRHIGQHTIALQNLDCVSSTIEHLLILALRINNVEAANAIYEQLLPTLGISPTLATEELRLKTLIKMHDAPAAKSIYESLRLQGQFVPPGLAFELMCVLAEVKAPLPVEAQSVFFDLLDMKDSPPDLLSSSFAVLTSLLLRVGDYPRLRQTLQDRYIDRIPDWRHTLSSLLLDVLSDQKLSG
jgi:hypothetical protein